MRIFLSIITLSSAGTLVTEGGMTKGELWVTGSTIALTIVTIIGVLVTVYAILRESRKSQHDQQKTNRLLIRLLGGLVPKVDGRHKG